MNRAPDDKFPAWIRFLSLDPKCSSWCVPPRQQTAFPSRQNSWPAAVFWYFWNSSWARCQWPGVNVKRRGIRQLLEYSEDNFRARERSQGAQTRVASTGQRRLLNSKAIRNNSELLYVQSRRNMFWWMRLTMETASLLWTSNTMLGRDTMWCRDNARHHVPRVTRLTRVLGTLHPARVSYSSFCDSIQFLFSFLSF